MLPKTTRYCVVCEKITNWKYDFVIGHSKCSTCGSRFGKNPKDKPIIKTRVVYVNTNQEMKVLKNEIRSLKGVIKELSKKIKRGQL